MPRYSEKQIKAITEARNGKPIDDSKTHWLMVVAMEIVFSILPTAAAFIGVTTENTSLKNVAAFFFFFNILLGILGAISMLETLANKNKEAQKKALLRSCAFYPPSVAIRCLSLLRIGAIVFVLAFIGWDVFAVSYMLVSFVLRVLLNSTEDKIAKILREINLEEAK